MERGVWKIEFSKCLGYSNHILTTVGIPRICPFSHSWYFGKALAWDAFDGSSSYTPGLKLTPPGVTAVGLSQGRLWLCPAKRNSPSEQRGYFFLWIHRFFLPSLDQTAASLAVHVGFVIHRVSTVLFLKTVFYLHALFRLVGTWVLAFNSPEYTELPRVHPEF